MNPFWSYPIGCHVFDRGAIYRVVGHIAGTTPFDGFLAITRVAGAPMRRVVDAEYDAEHIVSGVLLDGYTRACCGSRSYAPILVDDIICTHIAGVDVFHTMTRLICIIGHESGDDSVGMQGFAFSYQPTVDCDSGDDDDPDVEVGVWLYGRVRHSRPVDFSTATMLLAE